MGNFDESDATSYAEINRPNCLILGRFAEKQGSNRFGRLILASRKWARNARSAVSDAPHQKSAGRFVTWCGARPIQLFEGSRFVRGGRYGISIDFGLEVVERKNACGSTSISKFHRSNQEPKPRSPHRNPRQTIPQDSERALGTRTLVIRSYARLESPMVLPSSTR
jgi:hypothetical protein